MDCLIYCVRAFFRVKNYLVPPNEEKQNLVHKHHFPWLWIGLEDEKGNIVNMTDAVNSAVKYGDVVTPKYLSYYFDLKVKRWLYLDAETLVEQEFPTEGLLIKNDTRQSID